MKGGGGRGVGEIYVLQPAQKHLKSVQNFFNIRYLATMDYDMKSWNYKNVKSNCC
jgi:hypothetical protein